MSDFEARLNKAAEDRSKVRKERAMKLFNVIRAIWTLIRPMLFTFGAISCFVIAAFMFSRIIGFVVLGCGLLALEFTEHWGSQ